MASKLKNDLDILIRDGFRAFLERFRISFVLLYISATIRFAFFSIVLCNGSQLIPNEYGAQD